MNLLSTIKKEHSSSKVGLCPTIKALSTESGIVFINLAYGR